MIKMKNKLTQKRLKEVLKYYPSLGIFRWRTREGRKKNIIAGYKNSRGYIVIGIDGKTYYAHQLAFLYIHGYLPENGIDHIDGNPSNNKIKNLREVSHQCNMRNTGNRINNTSGVKGVYWNKRDNKWRAQICINGEVKYLGIYKNFDNAVKTRYQAEKKLNWEGCDSSSPAYLYLKQNDLLED
jgi:hypothetical protein